jgi:hypothetical protein
MYIEPTDRLLVSFVCNEDGTTSNHSACITAERATYTHHIGFDTHAEAEHLLARIKAAGEVDLDCWHVYEHGIFDTNADVAGKEPCERCASTGKYITGVENGKYKIGGATCYRCAGKGYHDQDDRKRNLSHDLHYVPSA